MKIQIITFLCMFLTSEGFSRTSVLSKRCRNLNSLTGPLFSINSREEKSHSDTNPSSLAASSSSSSFLEKTSSTATMPFLSTTRLYERIAEQVLDIVLLDLEATTSHAELEQQQQQMLAWIVDGSTTKNQAQQQKRYFQQQQILWIEQLSKIMTASGKTLWSQARMRSGILPSGRTVLGTVVDPLGVWLKEEQRYTTPSNQPPTSRQSTQEDRSVFLTRKLVELIHRNSSCNTGEDIVNLSPRNPLRMVADDLPPLSELSRPQLVTFSRILSAKIWDRRVDLVKSSNRFWKHMVSLQAQRSTKKLAVASGERLLQNIPTPQNNQEEDVGNDMSSKETERLQAARNFLKYYQSEDAEERGMNSVRTTL